jgi:hexosaminidase
MCPTYWWLLVSVMSFGQAAPAPQVSAPLAPAIIPRPAELVPQEGYFPLRPTTLVLSEVGQPEVRAIAEYLATYLRLSTGYEFAVEDIPADGFAAERRRHIVLLAPTGTPNARDESYALVIAPDRVLLQAPQAQGLFRGAQTLRQLLTAGPNQAWGFPAVDIQDFPRYRWRGMLLDCGRHFMSKDFVKRYIDLLAYHKLNVLHWHLTEDQGWRIEIKKYPKLTEIGAWRQATRDDEQPRDAAGRYGGFYTQDDIREIVAYARSRYVTIVPEIELPGHSLAALASYPELSCTGGPFKVSTEWGVFDDVYCAGNDHTFEFLQDVLTEVLDLFPSEFIHIGSDEVPKTRWKACPKCQARIKAEGLKDENELQSYFIRRIEKFLNSKGRRLVGWDEILEGGLAPNATVQSWRGMQGAIAAATTGHDVISSPTTHCYLDYPQFPNPALPPQAAVTTLDKTYSFEPTPADLTPEQVPHILGAEGNMWTERAPQDRVDHMVFPRLCALAEVTWSPKDARDFSDFAARMKTHYHRLDALGVRYAVPPPQLTTPELAFTEAREVAFTEPFGGGDIRYTLDGKDPTPDSPRYTGPLHLTETTVVKARTFLLTGNASDIAEFRFQKLTP